MKIASKKLNLLKAMGIILASIFLNLPTFAGYPNNVDPNRTVAPFGAYVGYDIGQGWVSHYFDASGSKTRYFMFNAAPNRSYCAEASQGSDSQYELNPKITITLTSGVDSVSDNGSGEPPMRYGSRFCFATEPPTSNVAGFRHVYPIKVEASSATGSDNGYIRFRVYETTVSTVMYYDQLQYSTNPRKDVLEVHNLSDGTIPIKIQTTVTNWQTDYANATQGNPGTIVNGFYNLGPKETFYCNSCYVWPWNYDSGTVMTYVQIVGPTNHVKVYTSAYKVANVGPASNARTASPTTSTTRPNPADFISRQALN